MVTFLSFSSNKFYNSSKRIYHEAKNMKIFDNILILNDIILQTCAPFFWNKHKDFILKNEKGYGFWLWKSFIILKTLNDMEENDVLIYADSGCTLNSNGLDRLNEYLKIVKNNKSGILTFQLPFFEKQYTKMDLFDKLSLMNTDIFDSNCLMASVIILKKCENTIKFVNEWYELSCCYHLIDDSDSVLQNDSSFIEHRHDQSIFSLLAKKHGSEIIQDETWYSNFNIEGIKYPFWVTRLK
jgi:hypothetical protein